MKALGVVLLAAAAAFLVEVWTPYDKVQFAERRAQAYLAFYQAELPAAEEREEGTEQERAWLRYLRTFKGLDPEPVEVYRRGDGGPGWTVLFAYKKGDPRAGGQGQAVAMDPDFSGVHWVDDPELWRALKRP